MARYGATLTVNAGQITGTVNNLAWHLDASSFPAAAVDGGASSILNGGGNARFYTDNTKENRLPAELVTFVTGVTPNIHVKGLSSSLTVGSTVYIEADTVETSQPAVDAAFGRNAVWFNRKREYNFEDDPTAGILTDSSGNTNGTAIGTYSTGDKVSGLTGSAWDFTLGVDYIDAGSVTAPSDQSKTVTLVTKFKTLTSQRGIFSIASTATDGNPSVLMAMRSGAISTLDTGAYKPVITPVIDTDYIINYVYDSIAKTTSIYINGALETSYASDNGVFGTGDSFYINSGFSDPSDQIISNASYLDEALGAELIAAEYNNQSNPSAFWSVGAWEDQDAAGVTVTTSKATQAQTVDQVTLTQHSVLSINGATQAQTVEQVTLQQAGTLSLNNLEQLQTVEQINLTQAHIISVDGATQSQTVEQVSLLVAGTLAVNNTSQSQTLEQAVLSVIASLSIDSLSNAQTVEQVILSTISASAVAVNSINQQQTVDQLNLTQAHVMSVDNLSQEQLLESINFNGVVVGYLQGALTIISAYNGQIKLTNPLTGEIRIL